MNRKKKWAVIVAAVAALAGGAGAATQWMSWRADHDGAGGAAARNQSPPIFVALDQFTVNLADEGGERLAQIAVTLEVSDDDVGTLIKSRMPSIRNTILLLLSSKRTNDLLTLEGKRQLAGQIAQDTGRQLGWQPSTDEGIGSGSNAIAAGRGAGSMAAERRNPIEAVHFAHFIVQ